jgi:ATP-dependent DNA helicase RecG
LDGTQHITDYLTLKGSASRAEINKLLMDKLSDALNDKQKDNKIANLLTNLRRKGRIRNTGSRGHPVWLLAE